MGKGKDGTGQLAAELEAARERILELEAQLKDRPAAAQDSSVQEMLDLADVMFVGLGLDGRINLVNRKACEVLAGTAEELLGMSWFDHFVPKAVRKKVRQVFRHLTASGDGMGRYVNEVVSSTGEWRTISWHNVVRRDASGAIVGVLSSGLDITDRLADEHRLRRHAEELAFLAETASHFVDVAPSEDIFEYVGEKIAEMVGPRCIVAVSQFDESDGKYFLRSLQGAATVLARLTQIMGVNPVHMKGDFTDAARQALSTGRLTVVKGRIQGLVGDVVPGWISGAVETFLSIEEMAVIGFVRDGHIHGGVTVVRRSGAPPLATAWLEAFAGQASIALQRHRSMEKMAQMQAQLFQSQKLEAIGQLAGGVAHDFNNILCVILGNVGLMLSDVESHHPFYEDLVQVKAAGDRAAALTYQLLAFGRRQALRPRVLDLNSEIRQLERMLRRLIGEDIDVVVHLDAEVGKIQVDPNQLQQVIINLAVNGRDAMPRGGTLTISTRRCWVERDDPVVRPDAGPGPYAVLCIADSGEGMDADTVARVFEPFFTTKELGKGTGLGLSTVHGIVRQSRGVVSVESQPGEGTRFDVYLPLVGETSNHSTDPGACQRPTHHPVSTHPGRNETILVVEDDANVRKLVTVVLTRAGFAVLEAANGVEALSIATEDETVDLVLTDLIMPHFGGDELCHQVRSVRPELKFIFMSGYSEQLTRVGEGNDGVTLIRKPFDARELVELVQTVLETK
jgi:PAS domain S-box-containing protein